MRQRLGQHFLRDQNVVQTILAAAELTPQDTVVEIGSGKGVLTEPLAEKVRQVIAIELDDSLAAKLELKFRNRSNVTVLHSDFLKVRLEDVIPADRKPALHTSGGPGRRVCGDPGSMDPPLRAAADDGKGGPRGPLKVLGNLPYSITSPIFEKIMPWGAWGTAVFLIQREVAARITAAPGSRDFGILTLAVQLFADAESVVQVKPGAFIPPPKVSSTVIRLRRKAQPLLAPEVIPDFFDLAHGAFAHRRKTIANSLAFHAKISRSEVEKWLLNQDLSPARRAETFTLSEYAKMAGAWSIFRREINLT